MSDVFPGAKVAQLEEWGYPKGALRPTPPADKAFSVIHITGNSRLPSAENEVSWRLNDAGLQNSATFFVNRDGSIVQALLDPLAMDPWANGDVTAPDLSNPRIAAVVRDGVNANERTILAIENVGYEPGSPITVEQENACARLIGWYHAKAGLPVTRETVIGHYQLNSVSRPNCPGVDKRVIDRIVAKAAQALPDTSLPEEDELPTILRRYVGKKLVCPAGTEFRTEPRFAVDPFYTATDTTEVQPYAVVAGEAYKTAEGPSNRWAAFVNAKLEHAYVPVVNGRLVNIAPDSTATDNKIAAGITAVDGAIQANRAAGSALAAAKSTLEG